MVVSFPPGIVRLLMDNPSPAVLSFCVKNTNSLQQILVNKQLIIEYVHTQVLTLGHSKRVFIYLSVLHPSTHIHTFT